jgi:SRSO17 transposase
VGVARQYCGMLGKQDNCQVAVSVTLACQAGSLPVAWQLYLPEEWAQDMVRRQKAGVPQDLVFATKPAIALGQIERLMQQGAPKHCVLADAGYGVDTGFREHLSTLGLPYVVGVTGQVTVWPPGHAPLPPPSYSGRGNVPTRQRLGEAKHQRPLSVKDLAFALEPSQWQTLEWREGSNFTLKSRFARVRVHAAHREHQRSQMRPEEWLLIEWPEGHREPMKYWLSTLPQDVPLQRMVLEAKMRWRIERDYQDLKQELGLGHYEGRGWRGFHHHASLSIAAYGFLMAEQLRHPEVVGKKNAAQRQEPALPTHYKPRGSPAHAAPRPIVHHDFAAAYRSSLAQDTPQMSVLPAHKRKTTLMTQ